MFVVLIQVVEDVEERLLRGFFADKELHVVNHKHVTGAIFFSETVVFVIGLVANDVDKLGHESFCADVKYVGLFLVFEKVVAYRVQKVSLAKTDARVYKQGVETAARMFRNGLASGECVCVGLAFDKILKGVFFKEGAFFLAVFLGRLVGDETLIFDEDGLLVEKIVFFVGGGDDHVRD